MFTAEFNSLRTLFSAPRPTLRITLQVAALFSLQVTVCILLLKWGYGLSHSEGRLWAVISAILALQPGFQQSLVTSVVRILANTVGACVALIINRIDGLGPPEMRLILAIIIVVFTCELLRLELALRTACVAVIIVLSVGGTGHVVSSGEQRFFATIIGCGVAMVVQLATDLLREKLKGLKAPVEPQRS